MKELATTIKGKGDVGNYIFKQLHKTMTSKGNVYMYEQIDESVEKPYTAAYEVFMAKISNDINIDTVDGRKVVTKLDTLSERYPSTNDFGITAWSFTNIDKAFEKMKEICKKAEQ